jgi:ATP/ADP translocase
MKSAKTDLAAVQGDLTAAQDALTAALRKAKGESDLKVEEILEQAREHVKTSEATDLVLALAKAVVLYSQKKVELERIAIGPLPSTAGVSSLLEAFVSWCYNTFIKKTEKENTYFILSSFSYSWKNKVTAFAELDKRKEFETTLITCKLDEIHQQLSKTQRPAAQPAAQPKVTSAKTQSEEEEQEQDKTKWQKFVELFFIDYDGANTETTKETTKNKQSYGIAALFFLGQFDYSLLRVLKDALVFSIAGGPAIAVLKVIVVISTIIYQAFHAKYLSIAEVKNRNNFHITNLLFLGFFILFALTITGTVPLLMPALPAYSWLGASINVLLANPWIALNYVIVEILGVRKMDIDLNAIMNASFQKEDIGRAFTNMGVWANIGGAISSFVLWAFISDLALIAQVKVAVILVTISTICSTIAFIWWSSKNTGNNASASTPKETPSLFAIANESSLSLAEILKVIKDYNKVKEEAKEEVHASHIKEKAKEEVHASHKTNTLQKFAYILFGSTTLLCFFGIIVACVASITIVEILLKIQVHDYALLTGGSYSAIMSALNIITCVGSIFLGLAAGSTQSFSSRDKALYPAIIFTVFAALFVTSMLAPALIPALLINIPMLNGISAGGWSIASGSAVVVTSKWCKYTLFDAANSEAWKREFPKPFKMALDTWQPLIKSTTGKISKASAATFTAAVILVNPLMLPVALAVMVAIWYTAASALHPAKIDVAPAPAKGLDTSKNGATAVQSNTIHGPISFIRSIMPCL